MVLTDKPSKKSLEDLSLVRRSFTCWWKRKTLAHSDFNNNLTRNLEGFRLAYVRKQPTFDDVTDGFPAK